MTALLLPTTRGRDAEAIACAYLERRDLKTLARNYRCRGGEIDLVMRQGNCTVFVEVRFRRSRRYGSALESVDRRKQGRILIAAAHYLQRNGQNNPCRFDVIAIEPSDAGGHRIEWIPDAFRA